MSKKKNLMQINVESNKNMNKIVKILKLYTYATQILYNYIHIGRYLIFTKACSKIVTFNIEYLSYIYFFKLCILINISFS
jgi:hypothetical protein